MRPGRVIAVSILLIIVLVAFVYAISMLLSTTGAPPSPGEVREYQGRKLSSIDDFRENSIKGPQSIDITEYNLTIDGLVNNKKIYSYEDVLSHPGHMKVATLNCVEGWSVTILWEGVLVNDLLNESGVKPGAKTIIFYAVDGYSTSFPLDYIRNNNIILAYRMNNVTMPPARGYPFQLVAENKWGYKWIKWVTRIELSDQDYRGYWEQRGYSNSGDLNASFLG
jgi:DMSO/TMAO reductase YedYZ molybdopterin-dependent catalytic subunit